MKRVDGLSLACWTMRARARSSGRNAHIRSSTVVYDMIEKNSENCTDPGDFWHRNTVLGPNCFLKPCCYLSMLCMRTQLFNSVNNPECMKQHCTPTSMTTRSAIGALHNNSSLNCRSHNLKYFSENNDQLCSLRYYGGHSWILGVQTVHCPVWIGTMIITSCTNAAARRC